MVFPSLQLTLALSCVMGLVMFACYCGEDHSRKLGASKRDAVSVRAGLVLCINDIPILFLPGLDSQWKFDGAQLLYVFASTNRANLRPLYPVFVSLVLHRRGTSLFDRRHISGQLFKQ